MKEQIEAALEPLIGLSLWTARRAADMEMFHFGARRIVPGRDGEPREVGEWALHLQCAWRLTGPEGIVVGSRDRFYAAGVDPYAEVESEDWDWDRPGANRCDERIDAFFTAQSATPPVVEAVSADRLGGFCLQMSGGHALEVFPFDSLGEEHWRLLPPSREQDHFVVTGLGVEE